MISCNFSHLLKKDLRSVAILHGHLNLLTSHWFPRGPRGGGAEPCEAHFQNTTPPTHHGSWCIISPVAAWWQRAPCEACVHWAAAADRSSGDQTMQVFPGNFCSVYRGATCHRTPQEERNKRVVSFCNPLSAQTILATSF